VEQEVKECEGWGANSGFVDDPGRMEYDAVTLGYCLPTYWPKRPETQP